MLRRPLCIALLAAALAAGTRAADATPGSYEKVDVAPAKTSIYVGTVTLTMPTFSRKSGVYEAPYVAKVFPYFFLNEDGRLFVDLPDPLLAKLAKGEAIEFIGRAVRSDNVERPVAGIATPTDAASGKLKVRVFVTKKTELIFNTTYRFAK